MPAAAVDYSANYGLTYGYDQGGNRTKKVQVVGFGETIETDYVYDISDPVMYGTANNRLMRSVKSHVSVTLVQPPSGDAVGDGPVSRYLAPTITTVTTLETKWYNYNNVGNLTRVITKLEIPGAGQRQYSSTWLTYALNGTAVTFAVGEEWDWDGDVLSQATNYNITYGRAFRYDGARQRYLHRTLNPSALMTGFITTLGDVWSDYSGDSIYGDYTVAFDGFTSAVTETASRHPGIGMTPWNAAGIDPAATEYYNSDMIGTLRAKTDATGTALAGPNLLDPGPVFTAFGEQVGGATERYGYAGAWGYQTDDATQIDKFPFQHVGARYYDPEVGRFLQRDPIGIGGARNVYEYVESTPTIGVDPSGLQSVSPGGAAGALNPRAAKEVLEIMRMLGEIPKAKVIVTGGAMACANYAGKRLGDRLNGEPTFTNKRYPRYKSGDSSGDGHPGYFPILAMMVIFLAYAGGQVSHRRSLGNRGRT